MKVREWIRAGQGVVGNGLPAADFRPHTSTSYENLGISDTAYRKVVRDNTTSRLRAGGLSRGPCFGMSAALARRFRTRAELGLTLDSRRRWRGVE